MRDRTWVPPRGSSIRRVVPAWRRLLSASAPRAFGTGQGNRRSAGAGRQVGDSRRVSASRAQVRWLGRVMMSAALSGVGRSAAAAPSEEIWPLQNLLGGAATTQVATAQAYSQPAPSLPIEEVGSFAIGNRLFNTIWVQAPASVAHFDGLGPLFTRASCSGCHIRDGRSRPPEDGETGPRAIALKLASVQHGAPDPNYGLVLSEQSIHGVPTEGTVRVLWREREESVGGARVALRLPEVTVTDLAHGPLADSTRIDLRIAPGVFGAGLLEAIPDSLLLAQADPHDRDGDGISGRVRWTRDAHTGGAAIGRYGWKAAEASLLGQVTSALLHDMGLTTHIHASEDLGPQATAARASISGGHPEVDEAQVRALVDYCRALAVPARRNVHDPQVLSGAALFADLGCAVCHTPTQRTRADAHVAVASQTIHPYTDLLLHDLGPGLASAPEASRAALHLATAPPGACVASASEWRTPPLWGLGLIDVVNGSRRLLHDGRARTLEEAILWHGGEATATREAYRRLESAQRDALHAFLESL